MMCLPLSIRFSWHLQKNDVSTVNVLVHKDKKGQGLIYICHMMSLVLYMLIESVDWVFICSYQYSIGTVVMIGIDENDLPEYL